MNATVTHIKNYSGPAYPMQGEGIIFTEPLEKGLRDVRASALELRGTMLIIRSNRSKVRYAVPLSSWAGC